MFHFLHFYIFKYIYQLSCLFTIFTGQSYTDWKKPEVPKEPDKPQFPEEKKKEIMDKEKVWVSEPQEGFVLGQIIDLTDEGAMVQPISSKFKSIQAPFDRLYPAEEDEKKEVDDNCGLMYLNEATLLHNIKLRYLKDKIYTYVANILIGKRTLQK